MIFPLVPRLDEGPLTVGVDDAFGWDEESESVDDDDDSVDDDENVDDDGTLEVRTTSVTCDGSVGSARWKPQYTSPRCATKELATV